MGLVFGARERHPVVDVVLRDLDAAGRVVDRSIDAADEMLLHDLAVHDGDWDAGLAAYFGAGRALASTVRQVARWQMRGAPGSPRLLDFASGYGRVTRFLVRDAATDRLWVSDIDRGAVEFQTATFGVPGLVSTAEPGAFECDERFDLIFVTSLFTHLPEPAFHGWLARLLALLSPRGVLAFSVHDASLLGAGETLSTEGLRFEPRSESRSLDLRAYGSTWVNERFVRAAIEACLPGARWVRLPRALCHFQDLYVVSSDGEMDLTTLDLDPGPRGFLDACRVETGGRLVLRGWVVQGGPWAAVVAVRIVVGGCEVDVCRQFGPRPDVQRRVPEVALECGFEARVALPERARHGSLSLVVEAETTEGLRSPVFAGTVGQALLRSARGAFEDTERRARRLAADVDTLRARIAAMESSRFWKLRTRWFGVKRALGLTGETS